METTNIQYKLHLTENHQLQAADALISKLKIQLGEANSYIEELEENKEPVYNELKVEIESIKNQLIEKDNQLAIAKKTIDKLTARYGQDLNELLKDEAISQMRSKLTDQIARLEEDLSRVTKQRDMALTQLVKLHGQESN